MLRRKYDGYMPTTQTTIKTLKAQFVAFRAEMNNEPEVHVFIDTYLVDTFVRRHELRGGNPGDALLACRLVLDTRPAATKQRRAVDTLDEASTLKAAGWISLGYDGRDQKIHFEHVA